MKSFLVFLAVVGGVLLAPSWSRAASEFDPGRPEFQAMALIVRDVDWQEKWNTPRESIPKLNAAVDLYVGEKVTLLVWFTNPTLKDGVAVIDCDLEIRVLGRRIRKTGPARCVETALSGKLSDIFLADMTATIGMEDDSPSGEWRFDLTLTDVNSGSMAKTHAAIKVNNDKERPE